MRDFYNVIAIVHVEGTDGTATAARNLKLPFFPFPGIKIEGQEVAEVDWIASAPIPYFKLTLPRHSENAPLDDIIPGFPPYWEFTRNPGPAPADPGPDPRDDAGEPGSRGFDAGPVDRPAGNQPPLGLHLANQPPAPPPADSAGALGGPAGNG